ncbi:hypothetical protein CMI47_03885 [Candidatus Pacearchaeota archaeon]|nr:hypothetical protein [Candidatus Pacearchaeota archaeon]
MLDIDNKKKDEIIDALIYLINKIKALESEYTVATKQQTDSKHHLITAHAPSESCIPYSQFISNPISGTNMAVDGSSSSNEPIAFSISSESDTDIFITKLIFWIQDINVSFDRFGSISGLSDTLELKYVLNKAEDVTLLENISTAADMLQQVGLSTPFWGGGNDTLRLKHVNNGDDAYCITWNLQEIIPDGIILKREENFKLEIVIKDDLTALSKFTVKALGYKYFLN